MANGLLGNLQPNGLLGPVTMNPNIAAQGRNALASALRGSPRNALLDPEFYMRDLKDSAVNYFSDPENSLRALSIAPVPVLSDVAGLAADALMYKNKPESRNMLNFGLTGVGMLPFIPALATAYHGSPYKFDKFDAAHIGKGEGAQAYGHGVYFAESPDVAQSYQRNLASTLSIDGKPVFQNGRIVNSTGNEMVDDLLLMHSGDAKAVGKDILANLKELRSRFASQPQATAPAMAGVEKKIIKETQAELAALRNVRNSSKYSVGGSLYKVDIPDEYIPRMLDWDKPLSQQPEILKAFKNTGFASADPNITGRQFIRDWLGDPANPETAHALKSIGIPGIRYLDGGSRGTGQGTSNYVVFPGNEGAVKILERK